jgi:hypothetical protein
MEEEEEEEAAKVSQTPNSLSTNPPCGSSPGFSLSYLPIQILQVTSLKLARLLKGEVVL